MSESITSDENIIKIKRRVSVKCFKTFVHKALVLAKRLQLFDLVNISAFTRTKYIAKTKTKVFIYTTLHFGSKMGKPK